MLSLKPGIIYSMRDLIFDHSCIVQGQTKSHCFTACNFVI